MNETKERSPDQPAAAGPVSSPEPVPPFRGLTEAETAEAVQKRRQDALYFSPLLTSLAKWLNVVR